MVHSSMSRRRFCFCCAAGSLTATGIALTPHEVFAQARDIVATVTNICAAAPINIYELRHGFHALEGSGGNIAVQSGINGKLMVAGSVYPGGL